MNTKNVDFSKLNDIAHAADFLPTRSIQELETNKDYQVDLFRKCRTMYGLRYTLDLDNECSVFLPQRITKFLCKSPVNVRKLSKTSTDGSLFFRYLGGKNNNCEFIFKPQEEHEPDNDVDDDNYDDDNDDVEHMDELHNNGRKRNHLDAESDGPPTKKKKEDTTVDR